MKYLNTKGVFFEPVEEFSKQYQSANPFPHIVIDDFFNEDFLNEILSNFPNLKEQKKGEDTKHFDDKTGIKIASTGERLFDDKSKGLMHFLNSEEFLIWLQELTGIKEALIPDPYFNGGGFHEISNGGFLKIHADYNYHPETKLDRRLNLLIYLNKDWKESYGGHLELWSRNMSKCEKKILPVFNRAVIFSTLSDSHHGHPEPLMCPEEVTRKSIALYYFSNGRPRDEIKNAHTTIYRKRPGSEDLRLNIKEAIKLFVPPILLPSTIRKLFRDK